MRTRGMRDAIGDGMLHFETAADMYAFVAEHAGATIDEAERTSRAVLELVGPSLALPALRTLASIPGFDVDLMAAGKDAPTTIDDLVGRASARAAVEESHALEIAYVVGRVVADLCGPAAISDETPSEIADLIIAHEPAIEIGPVPPRIADDDMLDDVEPRSLAEGHPRIAQPLSEAKAAPQKSSVNDVNPHSGSKLSSSRK